MSLRKLLNSLNARRSPSELLIEEEERIETKVEHTISKEDMETIFIDINKLNQDVSCRIDFIVDGVSRIAWTHTVLLDGLRIPVFTSQLVVGAAQLSDDLLLPTLYRSLFVVFLPLMAIQDLISRKGIHPLPPSMPPDLVLDQRGDFYVKLLQKRLTKEPIPILFCDTTFTFEYGGRRSIEVNDLVAAGKLRDTAMDRMKGILRALEIGAVAELRRKYPDSIILVDGPLALKPFLVYARLADNKLEYLVNPNNPQAFRFLSKLVGLVKHTDIIPSGGIHEILKPPYFKVAVCKFTNSDLYWHFLACYTLLRPELVREFAGIEGGLVRVDVPLSVVMDEYDPDWLDYSYWNINVDRLTEILRAILRLRTPVPHSPPSYRFLTELIAIHELECLLTSHLLPYNEIARYIDTYAP